MHSQIPVFYDFQITGLTPHVPPSPDKSMCAAPDRVHTLVLLSGGLDSLACAIDSLEKGWSTSALFVDYGQPAAQKEHSAAVQLAQLLSLPLALATVRGPTVGEGFIQARNGLLLHVGLMHFEQRSGLLSLGVHSGTDYVDCSPLFIREAQDVFDLYTDGTVKIHVPFLRWSKGEIWDFLLARKAPVHLTYSCERGDEQPCGSCLSCRDVNVLRHS